MRLFAVTFFYLSVLFSFDPRTDALAKEVAAKGWIVYSARTEKGDWDLFLMRPDGSKKHNITSTPATNEMGPRFSPDGKRLLYRRIPPEVKIRHDRWGTMGKLVVANSDGTRPEEIGDYPWATWSPNGRQVAILLPTGIEIHDLATKTLVRRLDRRGIYQQLFWSPDGKWFTGPANHHGENWTVVRLDASTGQADPIAKFQNCTADWFPDSRRLIFSSRPANQEVVDGGALAVSVGQKAGYGWTQLWAANGDATGKSLVYGEDGRHVYGGAVSPDMKYALFTLAPTDGGFEASQIHLMRLADAPIIGGTSLALRKAHPNAKNGPYLELTAGWEPHWTYAAIGGAK
jgi:Tol biopolymer transport system component